MDRFGVCCTPARPSGEDLLIQPLIRTCQGPKKELGRVSHFPHRDYGESPSGRTDVSTLPLSRGEKPASLAASLPFGPWAGPRRVSAARALDRVRAAASRPIGPWAGPRRSLPGETFLSPRSYSVPASWTPGRATAPIPTGLLRGHLRDGSRLARRTSL